MGFILDTNQPGLGIELRSESLYIKQVGKVDESGERTDVEQKVYVYVGTDHEFPNVEMTYGFLRSLLREIRDNEDLREAIEERGR